MKVQRNRRLYIWVPVIALGLIPVSAIGDGPNQARVNRSPAMFNGGHPTATAAPAADPAPASNTGDLSLGEFKTYVKNPMIEQTGSRVQLFGTIPTACAGSFQVANTNTVGGLSDNKIVGFEVKDDTGAFRSCMKDHLNVDCRDQGGQACTRISTINGTSLDVSNLPSGVITLASFDPSGDAEQWRKESFGRSYVSAADQQARLIASLKTTVATCRTADTLPMAQDALAQLEGMDAISSDLDAKYNKQLVDSQGSALEKQVGKVKLDDIDGLVSDITNFANQNPASCSKAVTLLKEVATREENDDSDGKSRKNYTNARASLQAAKDLESLDDDKNTNGETDKKDIAKALDDNQMGELGFCAENGDTSCLTAMSKTMSKSLNKKMTKACKRVNTVERESACLDAEKNLKDATQLYSLGIQAAQQSAVREQQMQVQMQQSLFSNASTPSAYSTFGSPSAFGSSGFGNTGFGSGGAFGQPGIGGGANSSFASNAASTTPGYGGTALGNSTFAPAYSAAGFGTNSVGPAWAGGSYASTGARF